VNLVIELVGVQLHSDELFNAANKCKGFEFREIEIGIEIDSQFGIRRTGEQHQQQPRK
jgi:hypothetical protein